MRLSIFFACFCAYAAQPADRPELIVPEMSGPMAHVVENTINDYTGDQFGWKLLVSGSTGVKKLSIVAGNATNNHVIAEVGRDGLDVQTGDLGPEGFGIVPYQKKSRQYVVLLAQT